MRSAAQSTENSTPTIFVRVCRFCGIILLSALLLSPAHAQPRISMNIERLDFKGSLLRLADGRFVAEQNGELFRLTPDARFERKLDFDPTRPFAGITGAQTEFSRLLAPRESGGFLASVNFYIPGFGWIEQRLASFDADGRLDSSVDTPNSFGSFIAAAIELPNGRLLYTLDNPEGDFLRAATLVQPTGEEISYTGAGLLGSARALAVQGSNVVVGGNLVNDFSPQSVRETNGLFRLNALPNPDSSFRAPHCKDISQLAVQSDGRILARGRLANAQGEFETNTTVFRLNADGSLERRFLQVPADDWRQPPFAVGGNDEIIILNADEFLRYNSDGSPTERGHVGSGWPFDNLDGVELLPDGSFLAHWYFGDLAGGPCLRGNRNHWVGFKPDGSLNPSFPPAPLDSVRIDLSITNMQTGHTYTIEQSGDLIHWEDALGCDRWLYGDNGSVEEVNFGCGMRMTEAKERQFFRVAEVP